MSVEGVLAETTAQRWIDEVVPLALALLRDGRVQSSARPVRVRARGWGRVEDGPYGGLMLTWPERHGDEAVINHLIDCRRFLSLYGRMLAELGPDHQRFHTVIEDGSRLRIAVTNDVLQVLAPGPERDYSMIRHHALMFLAAHLWLADRQRRLWTDLYRASLEVAGRRYKATRGHGAPRQYLDQLEHQAFQALGELAGSPDPAESADQDGDDGKRLRAVLDYMHAANAAVALLIDRYSAQPRQARTRWMRGMPPSPSDGRSTANPVEPRVGSQLQRPKREGLTTIRVGGDILNRMASQPPNGCDQ